MAKGGKLKEWRSKRRFRLKVKTWMLILVLLPLLFLDATLLRHDHIRMTELRDAVMAADASISENETDAEMEESDARLATALSELKEFVFSNIIVNVVEENGEQYVTFGTGPFYLEHQYIRAANIALKAAEEKLSDDENPNGNIYGKAGEVCRAEAIRNGWNYSSPGYINCMLSEIQKYPSANEIQDQIKASLPSTELFRKNYASPVWAPTVAGVALLATLTIIVVIFIRLIIWVGLRIALLFI